MLPEAKGVREAKRMAREWFDKLNAEADLMPNAGKAKTVDEVYKEYLQHQVSTGEIERSTYSNSLYSYSKYIKLIVNQYCHRRRTRGHRGRIRKHPLPPQIILEVSK